jgi:hypothetical protein
VGWPSNGWSRVHLRDVLGGAAVGSNEPQPPLDAARFERFRQDPTLRAALNEAGLVDFDALVALQGKKVLKGDPLLTDDRPALEYFFTLPLLSRLTETVP